jgi:hypothetical protein
VTGSQPIDIARVLLAPQRCRWGQAACSQAACKYHQRSAPQSLFVTGELPIPRHGMVNQAPAIPRKRADRLRSDTTGGGHRPVPAAQPGRVGRSAIPGTMEPPWPTSHRVPRQGRGGARRSGRTLRHPPPHRGAAWLRGSRRRRVAHRDGGERGVEMANVVDLRAPLGRRTHAGHGGGRLDPSPLYTGPRHGPAGVTMSAKAYRPPFAATSRPSTAPSPTSPWWCLGFGGAGTAGTSSS